ncbi:hypothetical protein CRENBAI_006588 [Crenichthys baileyi]|uniref:Uncharacterized protein n=1 Tax=Crenichthys baileyi TaxID=28760 RepID=A0AAV9R2T6_9TELE
MLSGWSHLLDLEFFPMAHCYNIVSKILLYPISSPYPNINSEIRLALHTCSPDKSPGSSLFPHTSYQFYSPVSPVPVPELPSSSASRSQFC